MVQRATSIAATHVNEVHMQDREGRLPEVLPQGVVGATPISSELATTAALGSDGADVEVLVVLQRSGFSFRMSHRGLSSPRASSTTSVGAAIAVRCGRNKTMGDMSDPSHDSWLLKYVFDASTSESAQSGTLATATEACVDSDTNGASSDDGGPQASTPMQVTICTRDGLVVARGALCLTTRSAQMPPSARYDYRAATAAARLLQAHERGRSTRRRPSAETVPPPSPPAGGRLSTRSTSPTGARSSSPSNMRSTASSSKGPSPKPARVMRRW